MTNSVDHQSFMQLAYRKIYPSADEFPEWDTWDVFRDFMLVPRHPALYPTMFMDLRTNKQKVFTNLHENVCGLLGVKKNFSKLEAVNPYVSTGYTFPQPTLADLKCSFEKIKLNKEK